ncbi:hypothetical protein ACFY2W_19695 [Streptomyces sp. NPDC001262]|uniref:hypothetical protein n=1 Tax=unclassified Streptomyces TaxID=2593676 RepID=UPI00368E6389
MSTEGATPGSTPEKPRRKHSPLAVASVAAAVLLAGGGGAYWASTAGGGGADRSGGSGDSSSPPPLALDGYGRAGGGPQQGIAPGEPDPHGVRYRAAGKLPDGPRNAPVYLPGREVTRDEVTALATALKVQGTPRLVNGVWTVGDAPDASGPALQVHQQAPGDWSFTRYGTPGGTHCEHPPGAGPQQEGKDVPPVTCPSFRDGAAPSPDSPDPAAAAPVPEDKAKSVAAPVLKALGQDGAKVDARRTFGAIRTVEADPVLNSLPSSGWRTTLQVGADGQLAGGSGKLELPKKGADYPVVSAQQALDALNKGEGTGSPGPGGCRTMTPFPKGEGADAEGTPPCPGGIPSKAEPATVRSAEFGLSEQSVAGRPALVPSWLFGVQLPGGGNGGATITVAQPAVDPKFIARPSPSRTPAPTGTPRTQSMHVDSYSVAGDDGRKLVLHFWGGVCNTYAVTDRESGSAVSVKVTGTEKNPGRPCVMMLKQWDLPVTLDKPLDDRKVVDETTGGTLRKA